MGTARLVNRVWETTLTTGTGPYALAGAVPGHRRFADALSGGTELYYVCADQAQWEIGWGTVTPGAVPTLSRNVIQSSNANALVAWGAGTRDIFCDAPAAQLLYRAEDDVIGSAAATLRLMVNTGGLTVSETGHGSNSLVWHEGRAPKTLAAKGEQTFPSGLKVKWGTLSIGSDASVTEDFLTPFTAVFGVLATVVGAGGDPNTANTGAVSAVAIPGTITVYNGLSQDRAIFYVALGM